MFTAKDHIIELNEFKRGLESMSEEILKNGLKECNLPTNSIFIMELRNFGVIVKIDKNCYCWGNNEPIHFKTLRDVYLNYQNKIIKYSKTRREKLKEEDRKEKENILKAINFLKSKGYIILSQNENTFTKL